MRISVAIVLVTAFLLHSCSEEKSTPLEGYEIANKWVNLTLFITKNTGANSPTYASRALGYIGLTMYESVVPALPEYRSILSEVQYVEPISPSSEIDPYYAMNAGQAEILRLIYNQTSDENKAKIDSLEQALLKQFPGDEELMAVSLTWGKRIAQHIHARAKKDGGHRGYLKNFDKEWVHPQRPGSWKPPLFAQSFSHHPLHPQWGRNQTFLAENREIGIPDYLPYDTSQTSQYYQQFVLVYEKDRNLTQKEKEAALWWGDDPDETFTPPGHSYFLAQKAVAAHKPDLGKAAETYARVGIAVADAFIKCWEWKFHHFTERANTYIPDHIDQSWESFWPDPPFPSFPSGHAMNAGTAAGVLANLFGDNFAFVDDAHVGRERDEVRDVDFVERHFSSFSEMADEVANSRFYGGIHIPYDNEVGLREGRRIAEHVNNLKWKYDD